MFQLMSPDTWGRQIVHAGSILTQEKREMCLDWDGIAAQRKDTDRRVILFCTWKRKRVSAENEIKNYETKLKSALTTLSFLRNWSTFFPTSIIRCIRMHTCHLSWDLKWCYSRCSNSSKSFFLSLSTRNWREEKRVDRRSWSFCPKRV